MLVLFSLSFLVLTAPITAEECQSRDYGFGSTVCVCTSEYCDTIPRPEPVSQPEFLIFTSTKSGLRFKQETGKFEDTETPINPIVINHDQKYQTILGFGGAFTDSTGINIDSLEEATQEKLLRSYFGDDGLEYSICRVPIGGTDLSTHGYSYDDSEEPDPELANFALAEEDHKYKIPYIKQALELTNNNVEFFASAWTAPKWMKTNGEYANYGSLIEDMYQPWADYFVKFLDNYKDQGVDFWGITTGNEPHAPTPTLPSVSWNATEMGKWILNNLGPAIRNSEHSDINIMILDDQRSFLPGFVDEALEDKTTSDYIDGIAVHWYSDKFAPASVLNDTHNHFPDKFILYTEGCQFRDKVNGIPLGSWERGEDYSKDIVENLQNWVGGWVDWNMVLDLGGGPSYIDNYLDAPIIVNGTAGEFYKQPMFYHLGHFSKFVPKGSVRIESVSQNEDIKVVAFQRPDNGTAVVLLNLSEKAVPVSVLGDQGTASVELEGSSITTILYW